MNKFLYVLSEILVLLIAATCYGQAAPLKPSDVMYITCLYSGNVNLVSGPREMQVLATAKCGQAITVTKVSSISHWYEVQTSDGKTGYISDFYLDAAYTLPTPNPNTSAAHKGKKENQPKQGKLQKRYAECTQQFTSLSSAQCWDLADHKFWVGMTLDQLIFSRGRNYTTNVTVVAGHVSAQLVFYDSFSTIGTALFGGVNPPIYYVYVEDGVVTAIQF